MNTEELVQELRNLNNPDLQVYIPCPHCCGSQAQTLNCWTPSQS